jgi:predicted nucleotidyltransferase
MPPDPHRTHATQEFARRLRRDLPANIIDLRLFGSEARGEAGPESDIDVLVVVRPTDERKRLAGLIVDIAFDVNLAHGVYISPRVVTTQILNDPVWRETPFLRAVVRDGIPI